MVGPKSFKRKSSKSSNFAKIRRNSTKYFKLTRSIEFVPSQKSNPSKLTSFSKWNLKNTKFVKTNILVNSDNLYSLKYLYLKNITNYREWEWKYKRLKTCLAQSSNVTANHRPRFRASQSAARIQKISHQMSKPCETLPCSPDFHATLLAPASFNSLLTPYVIKYFWGKSYGILGKTSPISNLYFLPSTKFPNISPIFMTLGYY